MRTVFAELYKGYIKLYHEKPNVSKDYDIRKVEIPDGIDGGRVFVGLSVANIGSVYGYGISFFENLDDIRNDRIFANERALEDLYKKITKIESNYSIKNYEYLISVH